MKRAVSEHFNIDDNQVFLNIREIRETVQREKKLGRGGGRRRKTDFKPDRRECGSLKYWRLQGLKNQSKTAEIENLSCEN